MGKTDNVALYRKYRGINFGEIIGQDHITDNLDNSIKSGRISHAYLFTGPKGVGKTSVARILAHKINGLEYTKEDNHIDIIEIDAASNRRIDEIRDLRDKAHVAPVAAKFKVYIIDEVHMLTKEAFNALLKTLEEPPSHVVFILATTEIHKLPQTIISRTQRHTFKPITDKDTVKHLAQIAAHENMNIDEQALNLIAQHGEGSFRDAISLLDQVRSIGKNKIRLEDVHQVLGLAAEEVISKLMQSFDKGDLVSITSQVKSILGQGIQPELLARQIIQHVQNSDEYFTKLNLIDELIGVGSSSQPGLKLELVLLEQASTAPRSHISTVTTDTKPPKETQTVPVADTSNEATKVEPVPTTVQKPSNKPSADLKVSGKLDAETWANVIAAVKKENNAIASILRSSKPTVDGNNISLELKFNFHRKKLEDDKVMNMIIDAISTASGKNYKITTDIEASSKEIPKKQSPPDDSDAAASIIDTFGGGERISM